jgi:hypothetical protein
MYINIKRIIIVTLNYMTYILTMYLSFDDFASMTFRKQTYLSCKTIIFLK